VAPGAAANLVVLDAGDPAEALRLQAARRWVIHAGRIVAETESTFSLHRNGTPASDALIPSFQLDQEQT
jgi:cytosine deaminase